MEGYEPRVVAVALVTGGLATSVVLARFGALGVPDSVSHRQAALLGVDVVAVLVGLTGMIVLAVRVLRAATSGFRLTPGHLVAAGAGRPLVAVGGVLLVQHLLTWWRHELASPAWQHSHARAGLLRWAPTEVAAVAALPVGYLLVLLSSSVWEARARRPTVTTAAVLSGIGPSYRATWRVCPTCDRAFASAPTCRGTAVWRHDEIDTQATSRDWKVLVPPPRPVVSRSFDAYLENAAAPLSRERHQRGAPDTEPSSGTVHPL